MKRFHSFKLIVILFLTQTVVRTELTYAWGSVAHRFINLKAVIHLPGSMNSFKAESLFFQQHAPDADGRKNPADTSFFNESDRHFIDIDNYLNFHALPHSRDSVVALYGWNFVKQQGTNPWATVMELDSLTAQLARHEFTTAYYTASDLGHYVADAHQPLHCTWNYWVNALHTRYETDMINMYQSQLTVYLDSAQYISSPLDFVFQYIYHSNSLVGTLIAAENSAISYSGWNGSGTPPASYYTKLWELTQSFTLDQIQRATVAIASLWYTAWVNAGLATSVDDFREALPKIFSLDQNYPNPFNPTTTVSYALIDRALVSLAIFSVDGKLIRPLVHQVQEPGNYSIQVNLSEASSGTYFYRIQAGAVVETRKMTMIK